MPETILTLVGNATADAELRFLPAGTAVAGFTVASTPRKKVNGEWVDDETLFVKVNAWRDLAEASAESIRKGSKVIVTGKLKSRSWEKDGAKRTVLELEADEIGISVRVKKTATASSSASNWGGTSTEKPPF